MTDAPQPSDEEIIDAVRVLHEQDPALGRSKVLVQLKADHGWVLSDKRLKKLLTQYDLKRVAEQPKELPPIQFPEDALAAQQRYKDESIRCFKLYGRGEYDYGVTPNADQSMLVGICHIRLCKLGAPGPYQNTTPEAVAKSPEMQTLWDYYWSAAQKVHLTKEDIGRQLEAEYGVNPGPYIPTLSKEELTRRKAIFKKNSMDLKRAMLKSAEGRKVIPVDDDGEPLWDDAVNGQFVVLVDKINKGDGLTEYGRV
ncbi:hypothetical protein P153DRAFT_427887 [Dothidotthia symphoricarpi CBS 119687]|uniref:Uncharacterized protein n=1 Tax=Dothidotthia symphoricarpi CBS 119687 TaxID=1392245 RepID=A0A6A6ATY3_9PLEO|nr:uncharacterized protein P153DRAFT_427887 [Dothidotthia symphoricarpi CBS 119687]KAF2134011.1 hypothetical protein P153DRAFT_427887 [Dothidotthia symphoricarpi CBS 119687]